VGSASIKKVLPVLVPELSYDDLEIGDGGEAMTAWPEAMVHGTRDKEATLKALWDYCRQDTLAEVRIWEFLVKVLDLFD
jgi:hypothetical protein